MTFGEKLKKLRIENNLTQKDLADQLHVTFQTVSKWENDTNEPDFSTLKELSKILNCSIEYLFSDSDEQEKKEEPVEEKKEEQPVNQTVIINQVLEHACTRCKKPIPSNEIAIDHVCVRSAGRGRSAEYRNDYYHKSCLDIVNREREAAKLKELDENARKAKRRSFGWGIFAGIVGLGVSLPLLLIYAKTIHPAVSVVISILIGYALFADLYCIISGSYIGEVFMSVSSWSIKFPGIIFTWDLGGLKFLIVMKLLFAILGFLFGIFVLVLAVSLSGALAAVSFPFILIHNIRHNYEDAL